MGLMMTYGSGNTFLTQLVTEAIKSRPRMMGSTKKSSEIAEQAHRERLSTMAEALAWYGNEMRENAAGPLIAQMPDELKERNTWSWIPAMTESDTAGWLRKLIERWKNEEWKDVSDEVFYDEVRSEFDAIVFGRDDFAGFVLNLRKMLVKAGVIDPDESDHKWIREEYEIFVKGNEPIAELAKKAGVV